MTSIRSYFGQRIRKRVPSRLQRKKRNTPSHFNYQPNQKGQVSLDDSIKQEQQRKEYNSLRNKTARGYTNYRKSRRSRR